jgi:hypothetical protein
MNDYNWEIKRRNLEGKHKKVAEFIGTTKGKMVSTYSATGHSSGWKQGYRTGFFISGLIN